MSSAAEQVKVAGKVAVESENFVNSVYSAEKQVNCQNWLLWDLHTL